MKKQELLMRHRMARTMARVVDWDRRVFDQAAKTVGSLQQRSEKAVQGAVEDAEWVPKEGKQLVIEWLQTARRSRREFRKAIDTSLSLTADFLKRVGEPTARRPAPARKTRKRRTPAERRVPSRPAATG